MSKAQEKSREETINTLVNRIDKFEKYSIPHSQSMSELATHLARRFGLAQSDVEAIGEAARLHDIGLYVMSPAYHSSANALRFEERLDLWRHPIIGQQEMAKRDGSRHTQLLVRWHHEWWNGYGYPDMLAFEDIPIGARILRAVELYNALLSKRPYRAAHSKKEALEILKASAGLECDPYVIHALLALLNDLGELKEEEPEPTPAPVVQAVAENTDDQITLPVTENSGTNQAITAEPTETAHEPVVFQPASQAFDNTRQTAEPTASQDESRNRVWSPETAQAIEQNLTPNSTLQPAPAAEPVRQPPSVWQEATPQPPLAQPASAQPPMQPPPTEASQSRLADLTTNQRPMANQLPPFLPPAIAPLEPEADIEVDDSPTWQAWVGGSYNQKPLLGFEVSVLRQFQFDSIAIPFSGEAKLDWYLKLFRKRILSNDSRAWAAIAARAMVESTEALTEDHINQLLHDIYIPGTRLGNRQLLRWFRETDAWWLENLRRNIQALEDERLRAQGYLLGVQVGDYALSFNEETLDYRRPLATVFWRLAGRLNIGAYRHPQNRCFNLPPPEFIKQSQADLLYLDLPAARAEIAGSQARSEWRECWVTGESPSTDATKQLTSMQSKQAYLLKVDEMFRAGAHIKRWAIGCQEVGLTSAREISELIKAHRPIRATYSKDVSEVAGGLRSYIIIAENV